MTINFNPKYQILGNPIPDDPHAVSVSLPTGQHTRLYEEGDPDVHAALQSGYPRFCLPPLVERLCKKYRTEARPGEVAWVFPTLSIAQECQRFVRAGRVQETQDSVALFLVPEAISQQAKYFWQHTGQTVSSRWAEDILASRPSTANGNVIEDLRLMVATHNDARSTNVFLYPTGMAAIFNVYKALVCKRGSKCIQLGFPYTDTLKILQKFGEGHYVPYNVPQDLGALEQILESDGQIAAVFCEIPGNPLLHTIDLKQLQALLQRYRVPLIIDDTLGTPFDVDVKEFAAATVTSLTKYFSGVGNVMGGSITLNSESPYVEDLRQALILDPETLYSADAAVLTENGANFFERMKVINANAEALGDFLRDHPAVDKVFYPKGDPAYEAIRRPNGGYGGLLSFLLKDTSKTDLVFDNLAVAKGPSLGTEFTLASLYTLLAHYNELDWAESQGVSRHLLRIAVGDEPQQEIIQRFAIPLAQSQLAPAPA